MGFVRWLPERNVASFMYNDAFVPSGMEPSPVVMPVKKGVEYSFPALNTDTFKGLPGMLAEALPDTYGRALMEQWLALQGRREANPVESLCFMGCRCMGALEFVPALSSHHFSVSYDVDTLVSVAREALSSKESFYTNLDADSKSAVLDILRLGTSAGGQRAKAVIAYNRSTGEVRSGQVDAPEGFEQYLIKLDGVSATAGLRETTNYGRVEFSFSELAKKAGIDMTECLLFEENGRAHFMTKRFDRVSGKKLHIQTLCGLSHYDYRLLRAYSYEQAFDTMRRLRLPYRDASQMFRRLVFNVVVRNQDDHTKNISFLMDGKGRWSLAPAYDIGFAYNPRGAWTSTHQMSVNGKFDNITRDDLLALAKLENIKSAEEIIEEVVDVAAGWKEYASSAGVPADIVARISGYFRLKL